MCDGIPDLGLPPIDPYEQDDIKVEYKRNQVRRLCNVELGKKFLLLQRKLFDGNIDEPNNIISTHKNATAAQTV